MVCDQLSPPQQLTSWRRWVAGRCDDEYPSSRCDYGERWPETVVDKTSILNRGVIEGLQCERLELERRFDLRAIREAKYTTYQLVVEVSNLVRAHWVRSATCYPLCYGSVVDLQILQRMRSWHEKEKKKTTDENHWNETGVRADKNLRAWALILDNEY